MVLKVTFEFIQSDEGRHTGTTELPLTANGEKRIRATGKALVGDDRLIVPRNLAYVSSLHTDTDAHAISLYHNHR